MPFDFPLSAISAADGHYAKTASKLAPYLSERALMSYRIQVEAAYLIALSELDDFGPRSLTDAELELMRSWRALSDEDAVKIKAIETKGHGDIKATRHDVKAIEYYLRLRIGGTSLEDISEWIHFGLTSEDVNNLSYALMLRDSVADVLFPAINSVIEKVRGMAATSADLPMLARTHGQPASPTTFGKEMAVFAARLEREAKKLSSSLILAKLNGATGNYNALQAAAPAVDWIAFTGRAIESLQRSDSPIRLEPNLLTAQIEPHDSYAELFQIIGRINTILIDLDQDIWRYVSDGWLVQQAVEGEVGSSTMPHKVNPIDFENSEGNLGIANALLQFFAAKLPISRLQRDLSDSTVERNFGLAFAHSLIGYEATLRGLDKVSPDGKKMLEALEAHPEVLAEAIQTILRREGAVDAYEKLLALTRGKRVTLADLQNFAEGLSIAESAKAELRVLRPETYIGKAAELARMAGKQPDV